MQRYYYLLHLQFLGFRYHGWQKQPEVKTVQFMLERTLNTVLGEDSFKTLGASRTDSMVSAHQHLSQITTHQEITDFDQFLHELNHNLPQDIKAIEIENIPKNFNPLNSKKIKTYHYYFSFGEKTHPFCAPFMTNFLHELDIPRMQKGAKLFEGKHNFIQYCFRGNENKIYQREINRSELKENLDFNASFFPKKSYVFELESEGFMRNQVRIMMGTLFALGQNQITLEDIKLSLALDNQNSNMLGFVAPASGLQLISSKFNGE